MIDTLFGKHKVRKVHQLLLVERKKMLEGPLSDLLQIVEEREELIRQLVSSTSFSPEDLKGIQHAARGNQRLIKASLAGLKAARKTIMGQKSMASATYTSSGERVESPLGGPQNDRKV